MAILLDKKEIIAELVKDWGREADCRCAQDLLNRVDRPTDSLIGRGRRVWAVDIADLMNKEEIMDLLAGRTWER